MKRDALAQLSAGNAMNVMGTKPAWFPEAAFDVCGELAFDGAIAAHDNNAKLQY
jgi:hypothetical protein